MNKGYNWGNPDPIAIKDARIPDQFREHCWRLVLYVLQEAGHSVQVPKEALERVPSGALVVCTEPEPGLLQFEMSAPVLDDDIVPPGPIQKPGIQSPDTVGQ